MSDRTKRDPFLDYLRGLAIVWVAVVHVTEWQPLIPPDSLGFVIRHTVFLWEMPVIFFVSGASLYLSHQRQPNEWQYISSRFRRLVGPYLPWAAVCIVLFYLSRWLSGEPWPLDHLLSWLIAAPRDTVPRFAGWYVWFIQVMILVSIAHIGLVRLFNSNRLRLPTALGLLAGIVLVSVLWSPSTFPSFLWLPRYVLFYGFFVYLGYYYASGRIRLRPILLALVGVVALTCMLALALNGVVATDTQQNKFPPNIGYALLGVSWIAFWLFAKPGVVWLCEKCRVAAAALSLLGRRSYDVYLWHGFGLSAVAVLWPLLVPSVGSVHYLLQCALYTALVLGLTLVMLSAFSVLARFIRSAIGRSEGRPAV